MARIIQYIIEKVVKKKKKEEEMSITGEAQWNEIQK